VPVSALWAERRPDVARVVRADEGPVSAHADERAPGGVREVPVGGRTMRVREWSGGGRGWPDEAESTVGEVLLYVVRGAIEIDLDGTVHELGAGDALTFDGAVRHRLRRSGPAGTHALYVTAG
jgi:mannose-6-phosphate isomerase-like protein (cupin superfamily)